MSNRRLKKAKADETTTKTSNQKPQYKTVQARTPNQQRYLDAIMANKLVICTGPAGSGKTHLAMGAAVKYMRDNDSGISRIIVSRPMISAARKDMGAIPGNPDEKMGPYLRPLEDELRYYTTLAEVETWRTSDPKKFEVVPLDHMRGRTFNNSFVILDEAQNAEEDQIEMILTRLGHNSKIVISGDLAQCDLPRRLAGGLDFFAQILVRLPDVEVVQLDESDIQRDPLVAAILHRIKDARAMTKRYYEREYVQSYQRD